MRDTVAHLTGADHAYLAKLHNPKPVAFRLPLRSPFARETGDC